MHVLVLCIFWDCLTTHIQEWHDNADFRNVHTWECFDYAYCQICIFDAYQLWLFRALSTKVPVLVKYIVHMASWTIHVLMCMYFQQCRRDQRPTGSASSSSTIAWVSRQHPQHCYPCKKLKLMLREMDSPNFRTTHSRIKSAPRTVVVKCMIYI